jgi:inorganic pyrophosphatase
MENNTSNLILEEDYWYAVTTYNGKTTTTTYHYISKAILIANIAADGEINWIKHIPKFQHTVNDDGIFNSFTYYKDKNDLKFVFADNSNNYDSKTFKLKPENAKNINDMKSSKQAKSIALAKIDANGNTEQKLIAVSKKHVLYTKYGTWSKSGKELYMQAWKRINPGQYALGCLFPPYGCFLLLKRLKPDFAVARLEID